MNWLERKILKEETMKWLKAHWPAVGGVIAVIVPFAKPSIDAFIAQNPHSTLAVLLGAIVGAYYLNSPRQQAAPKE
jgi:hypothetical protein